MKKRAIEDSNLWPLAPEAAPSGIRAIPSSAVSQRAQGLSAPAVSAAVRDSPPFAGSFSTPIHALKVISTPRALLSVREVARQLGLSTATVYKLCERGELAHARVSNAVRVAPGDLEAFIAARRKR